MLMVDVVGRGISDELNIRVARCVTEYFKRIDINTAEASCTTILKQKRLRAADLDQYHYSLLKNVAYYIETVDHYVIELQSCLSRNDANVQVFDEKIGSINQRFKNSSDHIGKYAKDTPSDTNDREYAYLFYTVYHEACLNSVFTLIQDASFFIEFSKSSRADIGRLLKDYLYNYTLHLLAQPT